MSKANSSAPTIVKKVAPYPFDGNLDQAGKKVPVQIRKLTAQGFIAHLPQGFVHVGEEYVSYLELPVARIPISAPVKVMKTYDHYREGDESGKKVERLAEFRFLTLSETHHKAIGQFLGAIKQA